MKTSTLFKLGMIFAILTSALSIALAGNPRISKFKGTKDSTVALEINGILCKSGGKAKKTYTVELMNNNQVVETMQVKEGGSFNFSLKANEWYAVRIKDKGCEPKLITIDTRMPKDVQDNYIHVLTFDVDHLITSEESKVLCQDSIDFPMAYFHFDDTKKEFNHNEEYRGNIVAKLLHPEQIKHN